MTQSDQGQKRDLLNSPADFLQSTLTISAGKAGGLANQIVEKALAKHGDDPFWQALTTHIMQHNVPEFHLAMLRDQSRNEAYRKAMERFAPGKVVLDIGTGSGLLAMMAARAGAAKVYACEANPMLAASARKVIAANGLTEKITVFDCHSTKLGRQTDLDGGVDLVVSEIFSEMLIGEGVLHSLRHACDELVRPGAIFLPEHASIQIALAQFPAPPPVPTRIEGFDLTAFAPHLVTMGPAYARGKAVKLRSASETLFGFDFTAEHAPSPSAMRHLTLTSTGGRVEGLAQWIRLRFADDIVYENFPRDEESSHWVISLTQCPPADTLENEAFDAGGWYHEHTLVTWCQRSS